jgi:hypothetical protein
MQRMPTVVISHELMRLHAVICNEGEGSFSIQLCCASVVDCSTENSLTFYDQNWTVYTYLFPELLGHIIYMVLEVNE